MTIRAAAAVEVSDAVALVAALRAADLRRGGFVGVAIAPGVGLGVAVDGARWTLATSQPVEAMRLVEAELRPRWTWWSVETAGLLIAEGLRVAACWDCAAVHRLLTGEWHAEPARVWAGLRGLDTDGIPPQGQLDLLGGGGSGDSDDPEDPVRPDLHLRPEWAGGAWASSPGRAARWAALALTVCKEQRALLDALSDRPHATATARSESAAELLCAELAADGLPIDIDRAEEIIGSFIGPRPAKEQEAAAGRARRDAEVLRHVAVATAVDLRNPMHVRTLLRAAGIEVPDTRAWRLKARRDEHPVVDALLTWRRAERIETTFGYSWLSRHVHDDRRLRGAWSGSDGAAGRMTAQAGLHNMPSELRPAVAADDGWVFVRADLGQIEPRVLAAVSGDAALAKATDDDDLYAPVAARLGVERAVAKVAVLAAMYGQTSGAAGQALRGMESAYPVAMRHLLDADLAGQAGRELRTYGGRLIRMWENPLNADQRAAAAARGRYARNAIVQGAAAELFKVWAATVRARAASIGARIVLCLHDELLLHVPERHGDDVAQLLVDCLGEAAYRWAPDRSVRFVADVCVVRRWSDAK